MDDVFIDEVCILGLILYSYVFKLKDGYFCWVWYYIDLKFWCFRYLYFCLV